MIRSPIRVEIIGAPIACKDGIKDSWREVADWLAGQIKARYGDVAQVHYFDLFSPNCPAFPADVQLPVVMIEGQVISNGGKISLPVICKAIDRIISTESLEAGKA